MEGVWSERGRRVSGQIGSNVQCNELIALDQLCS